MRRILLFLLALSLICTPTALGAAASDAEVYRYIQLGDSGFPLEYLCTAIGVEIVYEETGEDSQRIEPVFNNDVLDALLNYQTDNGLGLSGVFDATTLRHILNLPVPAQEYPMIWIPMHGGIRYHVKSDCSKMYESRQMPVDCARAFRLTSCGKCMPDVLYGIPENLYA